MRVLAAMSGGVDSAVAAARAVEAGHEVVGVHLALSAKPGTLRTGSRGCCTVEDAGDARRAADALGIPFYVWDFSERFTTEVVEDFVADYERGRTPNPCLRCNERIKFAALLERALDLGFDAVCTGHYARLDHTAASPVLRRAVDAHKDQSYVLASLTGQQLGHAMFPLGDTPKPQVRAEAERRGLSVAEKPDSHDICFIPDGDTRGFLDRKIGNRPGEVIDDRSGEVLGEHQGTHGFTIGQRKGLGVQAPAPDGRPRYVLSLEPVERTVRVGSAEDLQVRTVEGEDVLWHHAAAAAPEEPMTCTVQVRAHGGITQGTVLVHRPDGQPDAEGSRMRVDVAADAEPLTGVAPGQAVVLYRPGPDGEVVIGCATITESASAEKEAVSPGATTPGATAPGVTAPQ